MCVLLQPANTKASKLFLLLFERLFSPKLMKSKPATAGATIHAFVLLSTDDGGACSDNLSDARGRADVTNSDSRATSDNL